MRSQKRSEGAATQGKDTREVGAAEVTAVEGGAAPYLVQVCTGEDRCKLINPDY